MLSVLAIASVLLAGCSTGSVDPDEARDYVLGLLHARARAASRGPAWARTLDEMLPNVSYQHPDGRTETLSDLVIVGHVAGVAEGLGFEVPGGDAPDGQPTDFDSPAALWRTVHMRVEVEETIGPGVAAQSVQVGLAFGVDTDFEKMAAGLRELGEVVVFLEEGSPVFAYEPSLYAVVEDGSFIVTIGPGGTLELPVLDSERASGLLSLTRRLDDLRRQGQGEPRTVPLRTEDGVTTRQGG